MESLSGIIHTIYMVVSKLTQLPRFVGIGQGRVEKIEFVSDAFLIEMRGVLRECLPL